MTIFGRSRTAAIAAAIAIPVMAGPAWADEISTYTENGVAIGGVDPVSYFKAGEPADGSPEYTAEYDGVTWQFASAENRDAFVADPERYAPAYGGWCATGTSFGKKVPVQKQFWDIVDGRLYLNSSEGSHNRFLDETSEMVSRANETWPEIQSVPADQL